MPATEAQIAANRANSLKSTGPKTPEGKEASRANSYKHGLTGAGVVQADRDAAELGRRVAEFVEEVRPSGPIEMALVRHAALMSLRMERCTEHEMATTSDRVARAEADFVPPEDADEESAARLRALAGKRALFDPSPEATLARKYEAAAVRDFHRALKELRAMEKADVATLKEMAVGQVASIFQGEPDGMSDEEFDRMYAREMAARPWTAAEEARRVELADLGGRVDVPFTIGKAR